MRPDGDRSERYKILIGNCTMAAAPWVAIFVAIFVAISIAIMSEKHWKRAQDRARARRLADARIAARLLRLFI